MTGRTLAFLAVWMVLSATGAPANPVAGVHAGSADSAAPAPFIRQALESASEKLNRTTPRMIDKDTRLETTFTGPGRTWTFVFTIIPPESDIWIKPSSRHTWRRGSAKGSAHSHKLESSCSRTPRSSL